MGASPCPAPGTARPTPSRWPGFAASRPSLRGAAADGVVNAHDLFGPRSDVITDHLYAHQKMRQVHGGVSPTKELLT